MPTGADRRWRQRFLLPPVPLIKVTGRVLGAEVEFYFESGQATELFLFKFCGQP
jgi:hypothetical protein